MPLGLLRAFFRLEAAGGIVLVLASAVAIWAANSPLAPSYQAFLDLRAEVRIGELALAKPLLLWINDGLMAIFFFLVGLEMKREFREGELSSRSQVLLPAVAAVGGMAVPAAIYVAMNAGEPENLSGWAIPSATDIAFALGVLSVLGSRVPVSLKVLLTAIAIFDDLGAIVIIALFYSGELSVLSLALAGVALGVLAALNLLGVTRRAPYLLVGLVLWVCVLKSGVHATLAGVLLAMAIPMGGGEGGSSPLKEMEHDLHPWVAFAVLPLFGFANAGVSLAGVTWGSFLEPVTLGVGLGLLIGKQVGVFSVFLLAIRGGLAPMPSGANWLQLYGVSVLCGIGFTMSLFIGGLSWDDGRFDAPLRMGVLTGSVMAAILGLVVFALALAKPVAAVEEGEN
ncbi:MAG: Na+/H+ antiporter NhaA [Defluviicoccus sp.]|nr:Na+/H+ antiporter NhaA [Defluviicoccus sp.]MDS4073626.1 Na+/H+ antiporter NhaA [Defluviicoccus sp.]